MESEIGVPDWERFFCGETRIICYRICQLEKHAFPFEVMEQEQCVMNDEEKTRAQLIEELTVLRQGMVEGEGTEKIPPLFDYAGVFEGFPIPATLIDARGIVIDVNRAFLEMAHRYDHPICKEDRVGQHIASFAETEKERTRFRTFIDELLHTGETHIPQWICVEPSGRRSHWQIHAEGIRDAAGQVIGALILREDVTEKVRKEQRERVVSTVKDEVWRMKNSEDMEKILIAIEDSLHSAGVVFTDCGINLLDSSHDPPTQTGYTIADGKVWDWESKFPEIIVKFWRTGAPVYRQDLQKEDLYQELPYMNQITRSIVDVPFHCGTVGISSTEPNAFSPHDIEILQDMAHVLSDGFRRQKDLLSLEENNRRLEREITERKQLEEERIHTQRFRAIGELAAGVSHNLNNMLVSVLGPAQLLTRYSDDPRVLQEAETIIAGARRASDLVLRLNQAVRGAEKIERVPVLANKVIQDAIQVARPRWKDEAEAQGIAIEVATNLGDVPTIRGMGTGLHDILLNLLSNAVDAMPEGGTITIGTQPVDDDVRLTVHDTGTGMDEETKRRVFEPLFTTKMDVGSGLGLATVHSMVESWGGRIEVESAPGQGATFTLWLPAWDGPETPSQDAEVAGGSPVRRCRLLVVEDDESVCRLLESLLSDSHEVEIVLDGPEALEGFIPGRYDVVLIDLGLPGMSGDRVVREMKRVDPAVVSVLITGWVMRPDDVRLRVFDFQLPKPFDDLDEVEDVVAQAIDLHDERVDQAD